MSKGESTMGRREAIGAIAKGVAMGILGTGAVYEATKAGSKNSEKKITPEAIAAIKEAGNKLAVDYRLNQEEVINEITELYNNKPQTLGRKTLVSENGEKYHIKKNIKKAKIVTYTFGVVTHNIKGTSNKS